MAGVENINRNNFPSADNLRSIIYNNNFNRFLNIVKTKIDAVNNLNYIRILNNELVNIPVDIIIEGKIYLSNSGYKIIQLEDVANTSIGFKVEW